MNDTDWRTWRDTVKARIDVRDLAAQVGDVGHDGKMRCVFHEERTPSLQIYRDHYKCFGCAASGDVFTWLEKVCHMRPDEAIVEAARLASIPAPTAGGAERSTPPLTPRPTRPARRDIGAAALTALVDDAAAAYRRAESPEARAARAYVTERGLGDMAEALRFGVLDASVTVPHEYQRLRGRLIVPTIKNGRPVWFKARYVGPLTDAELKERSIRKYDGPSGTVPAPFNADALDQAREQRVLVLVEGELDAAAQLLAMGDDWPVMGLPGGLLPAGWDVIIAETDALIITMLDADDAGATHTERVVSALQARGARVKVAPVPEGHNDHNAALRALGCDLYAKSILDTVGDAYAQDAEEAAMLRSDRAYVEIARLAEMDARADRPHVAYSTDMPALDALLGGGLGEGLHVLGGITGTGKTSLALHIALHNARARRPVLYLSYEQSKYELWGRLTARLTTIPQRAQKRGWYEVDGNQRERASAMIKASAEYDTLLRASDYLRILEAGDALSRTESAWTLDTVARVVAQIAATNDGAPPLIIVDYLQRMPAPAGVKSDVRERVSAVAGALQILARATHAPVLALSSLSRNAYRLGDPTNDIEGKLSSFKEAGELEYTAHTATVIYGVPDKEQDGLFPERRRGSVLRPMAVEVVKNRDGAIGRVATLWDAGRDLWSESKVWRENGRG